MGGHIRLSVSDGTASSFKLVGGYPEHNCAVVASRASNILAPGSILAKNIPPSACIADFTNDERCTVNHCIHCCLSNSSTTPERTLLFIRVMMSACVYKLLEVAEE
ncbi:hypothetical protein SK128_009666 [Halocaridina rubra]|uniref:Uncharacterized protein n=1 Tax=Halocaridina rubra TaxID=373956 RepID=A0AAN8X1K9_HALRR